MRFFNYSFHSQIKGGGKAGMRINSLVRVKIGLENGDGYEPSMEIGSDYIKLFGDKFNIDHIRCGKDWEKHFNVSQVMSDGEIVVTIKKLTNFPIVYTRDECTAESADK